MASSVFGGGTTLFLMGMTQGALFRIVMIAGAAFYLPELIILFMAKKRKESIFLGLPDALDLMLVCVEADAILGVATLFQIRTLHRPGGGVCRITSLVVTPALIEKAEKKKAA